jgi:hypothetical protein
MLIQELKTGGPPKIKPLALEQISSTKKYRSPRIAKLSAREEFYKKQVDDISKFLKILVNRPRGYTWERYYEELVNKNLEKLTKYLPKK